ncbi:folate-binding protein YgfZ [Rhodobacteraceae bacterium MCCB 386]|nr:folate-binding protein YgfZ [Roseitranquillus sediminis]
MLTDPRTVLAIGGDDRKHFLQDLVTNDVGRAKDRLVYAALLSPQGKYLADFMLLERDDTILLDVATPLAEALARRLAMYKLRAKVTIEPTELGVRRGRGQAPDGALADPRHPDLPWRLYGSDGEADDPTDVRVRHVIPLSGVELVPEETYILEAGFERLNGVDFRKGCYVGQEVTARMKHKTELRKGLTSVRVEGEAPVGTAVTADGRGVGTLYSQSGGSGIAHLRFDRAAGEMQAGDARLFRNG